MPTSKPTTDPIKAAKAARFRSEVRHANPCPTCGAPQGYFCKSEITGGRREANHRARVEALTGFSMSEIDWRNQRVNAAKRCKARKIPGDSGNIGSWI